MQLHACRKHVKLAILRSFQSSCWKDSLTAPPLRIPDSSSDQLSASNFSLIYFIAYRGYRAFMTYSRVNTC